MKKRNLLLFPLIGIMGLFTATPANADVRMSFERTSTSSSSVKVLLTDENGQAIQGATATVNSSHNFMPTQNGVTNKILCPQANGMDSPTIKLTFNIKGLPKAHPFTVVGLDIHAFNKTGGYQKNTNDKARKFNVNTQVGQMGGTLSNFGKLNDIDIAANVGTEGDVHQLWSIKNEKADTARGDYQVVVTITKGSSNFGCFFGLSEIVLAAKSAEKVEKTCPFKTSPAIGNAYVCYSILSTSGKALKMTAENTLTWTEVQDSKDQVWYFVEKNGGYLIVNMNNDQTYNLPNEKETVWTVADNAEGQQGFLFVPQATQDDLNTKLTVEGESAFVFQSLHNAFARAAQIYEIPCGVLGSSYITQLEVKGQVIKNMQYPLSQLVEGQIVVPEGATPTSEYYIYTEDQACAAVGDEMEITMQLNEAPAEGLEGYAYFDWNRDGIFEANQKITLAQNSTFKVTVPENAKPGKSKVRIRLTDNGMTGADQEVTGQIFDWNLRVADAAPESFQLNVKTNDKLRGTVTASETAGYNVPCTVKATPRGNSTFVCWREGLQIRSVDTEYAFTLDHETNLIAYFSPNTEDTQTGIENHFAEKNHLVQITAKNKTIKIQANSKVKKVLVFRPDGQLVAESDADTVQLTNVTNGAYIVKVYTETADETEKILLQ